MITLNLCPTLVPIGVTVGWGLRPTRLFCRSTDGAYLVVYGDRDINPHAYDDRGWPIGLSL